MINHKPLPHRRAETVHYKDFALGIFFRKPLGYGFPVGAGDAKRGAESHVQNIAAFFKRLFKGFGKRFLVYAGGGNAFLFAQPVVKDFQVVLAVLFIGIGYFSVDNDGNGNYV